MNDRKYLLLFRLSGIVGFFALLLLPSAGLAVRYTNVFYAYRNAVVVEEGKSPFGAMSRATKPVSRYSRQINFLKKARLLRNDGEIAIDQTVIYARRGRLLVPYIGRAGRGTITFAVDSTSWTAADKALLEKFVGIAYPTIVAVYGAPAQTATVKIVRDDTLIDRDWFTGGIYDLTNNIIRLPRYRSNKSLERGLLHLMVHAFHGPARFGFDAWEEGFARAASVVVGDKIDPALASAGLERLDFLAEDGDVFYYLMPIYDLLNQPALGNKAFLTSWTETIQDGSARFGGMLIPRLGMSSTAWLKVYIELLRTTGGSFFALFNDRYYAEWSADNSIASNVSRLKAIAAGISPEVEGFPFNDWYRRQYVFDTSVTIGKKLFAYVVPLTPQEAAPEHYSAIVFLMHYITMPTGDETPISGSSFPIYWNYLYDLDIYLGAQYEEVRVSQGEGYLEPTFTIANIGGAQRVAMDFTMNDMTERILLPVGLTGNAAAENSLYGVVLGANSGTLVMQVDSDPPLNLSVERGGFGTNNLSARSGFSIVRLSFSNGFQFAERRINKGPGRCAVILDALDSVRTLQPTFSKGWQMISVPGTPLEVDHAAALGVNRSSLVLGRWQPDKLGTDKYLMYPQAPAFRPGIGYWLKGSAPFTAQMAVRTLDQAAPWHIGLMPGWNQVGCPFLSAVSLADIQVEVGNMDPITYAEARANRIVSDFYEYEPASNSYIFASSLEPWKGYWIRCLEPRGAVIRIPGPEQQ